MTRRLLLCVTAVVIVSAPVAVAQSPAEIRDVGWWTQTPSAQPKDDGGFEVARGPSGDISVAAIRIDVLQPLRKAVLVAIESGGVATDQAAIRVCPTSDTWAPANPGAWSERPATGCDRGSAELKRTPTGWAADVLALIADAGPRPSLVLVPDAGASNPLGFQVDFAGATLDAEAFPEQQTQPPPAPAPPPSFSEPTTTFPQTAVPEDEPRPAPDVPEQAPPEQVAPAQAAGTFPQQRDTVPPHDDPGPPWGRLAYLIPLAGAAGAAVAYGRKLIRERGILRLSG